MAELSGILRKKYPNSLKAEYGLKQVRYIDYLPKHYSRNKALLPVPFVYT
jgi:hypothetical protein